MSNLLPTKTKLLLLIYLFELSFLVSVKVFKQPNRINWVPLASAGKSSNNSIVPGRPEREAEVAGITQAKRYLVGTVPCPGSSRLLAPNASENLLSGEGKTNRCIFPQEIVLHWNESAGGNAVTYATLEKRGLSCQLAVDTKETWQLLELYPNVVELGYCTGDWQHNLKSINIEMAGNDFDNTPPPEAEMERTLDLVCWLLKQYQIPKENILGHFQIVEKKKDPGGRFLEEFKEEVKSRCF